MKFLEKPAYARRITPTDGEYFFGYYDLPAFSGKLHLTHKTTFADRLHMQGDKAELGVIDIESGKYEKLDETAAWNFQQGAMLQWNPAAPGREVIYNSMADGEYIGVIMDISNGKKRFLDRPVANVSPKGDYALSVNFSRLYNFRPGYGYADIPDRFYYQNHSDSDGIYLTDLLTGKSRLILSMEEIWDFSRAAFGDSNQKMIINHITFNTDGSRFLFLARNFHPPETNHVTATITADRDGKKLFLLSDYGVQSHYHWKDREHVIFYSDGKELDCTRGWANTYLLEDQTYEGKIIADGFFAEDNHMSYSPDRKFLVNDTYADIHNMQSLRIYHFETNTCIELGKFYTMPRSVIDIRCDLHPRWNETGSMISFDSTHEGRRGIYLVQFEEIKEAYFENNE